MPESIISSLEFQKVIYKEHVQAENFFPVFLSIFRTLIFVIRIVAQATILVPCTFIDALLYGFKIQPENRSNMHGSFSK